ncbi:DUF4397 domain-containing protein [Orlajensenia leifsoniae]|uniref:DUF4397 domain-containing protein n=1 Tax=Orlajensenia leifsoniae TaxID=2561933 RepID=A0A4Y9R824_9MICO|nr:DUF4397 domain-containing protein [Leifsonia flava]TFW00338.1 DUF4397 domain-containing protein [Leifsonia flava]
MRRTTRRTPARRRLIVGAAALTATALVSFGLGAAPALAAVRTAPADAGWVRVGHLSPDTAAVDVRLAPADGGAAAVELDDVTYGQVSPYAALAAGDYELTMVPAGAPADTTPVVTTEVTVTAGMAGTVAAYGLNDSLQTMALGDDLTSPAAGEARIRVVSASTQVDSVDVTTTTGVAIATGAASGTATDYASVPSGPWDLVVTTPDAASYDASVTVDPGTISTLFVLDNASGGLTVLPVLDGSAAGDAPDGSLDTGGGALRDAGGAGAFTAAGTSGAGATDPITLIASFLSGFVQAAAAALR